MFLFRLVIHKSIELTNTPNQNSNIVYAIFLYLLHAIIYLWIMSEIIFIHIPKTGGTTINTAMQKAYWQTKPGFNYRHILQDKSSNSGDIFNPKKANNFKEEKFFMMLRHPVDRLISEYYFIKERNEFTDLLKPRAKDFESYIRNRQTQNYMVNFLKGKRMYSTVAATEDDLEDVLESIDELPIHVGIFEQFSNSLAYFSKTMGIEWDKNISIKRMTLRRPKMSEVSDEIKQLIEECNPLDMELYNYCLKRFNTINKSTGKFSFHGDRYDHIVAYAARACLYEFCLNDKVFIKKNFNFFKDLTFYLINDLKIKDGKVLTATWNKTFLVSFDQQFPKSVLHKKLSATEVFNEDPIEHAHNIGQIIDAFFKDNKSEHGKYSGMVLNKALIPAIEPQKKSGFLKSLFGK